MPTGTWTPTAAQVTFPIYDYPHTNGNAAITGGYVYRGGDIVDHGRSLDGTYIFGDYVSGRVYSFSYDGTTISDFLERTTEMNSLAVLGANSLDSFGEDNLGRVYAVDIGGQIFRITGVPVPEPATMGSIMIGGVILLGIFVLIEARSARPLLPLRLLEDRTRAGSYLAVLFAGVGMFGVFLFVTYFMQQTLGFSPLMSGAAFLPMIGSVIVTSIGVNALLLARVGPRILVAAGMLLAAVGLVLLTRLSVDSTYASGILPSLFFLGAGLGLLFPTATNTATAGVVAAESGVASSLVNVGQQVGGSLGTALLNTVAVSATSAYVSSHHGADVVGKATVHGYTVAFWWSAAIFVAGALVCGALLPGRPRLEQAEPAPAATSVQQRRGRQISV